jgi:hypothetical protein
MNVYELNREKDAKGFDRYQQLIVADLKTTKRLDEYESRLGWFDNHQLIGNAWFSVQIEEWEYTYTKTSGDYPVLAGFPGYPITPIFSHRAAEALAELLEGNGELLPLTSNIGEYYAFNITCEVDALDEEHSEFKLYSELYDDLGEDPDFLLVTRFMLYLDRVADLSIFKLPKRNRKNIPLVTDRFVQRVQEANLQGFAFNQLWTDQPFTATV